EADTVRYNLNGKLQKLCDVVLGLRYQHASPRLILRAEDGLCVSRMFQTCARPILNAWIKKIFFWLNIGES
ncbi:hypothetical protein DNP57_23445, partial [Salmonella enterica subsp. enterica serovar Panama]|uniref:hypothetical protein n=1 Tax=Salmonella enterica TaxID=28901 RepID=UPI001190603A